MIAVKAQTGMSMLSLSDSATTKNVILLKYYTSFLTSVKKKNKFFLQIHCLRHDFQMQILSNSHESLTERNSGSD